MGTVHNQVHGESYQCIPCHFYGGRIPGASPVTHFQPASRQSYWRGNMITA